MRTNRATGPVRYAVVIEGGTDQGFSAHLPDFPACVASGRTVGEVQHAIRKAAELLLRGMRDGGLAMPEPLRQVSYVEIERWAATDPSSAPSIATP